MWIQWRRSLLLSVVQQVGRGFDAQALAHIDSRSHVIPQFPPHLSGSTGPEVAVEVQLTRMGCLPYSATPKGRRVSAPLCLPRARYMSLYGHCTAAAYVRTPLNPPFTKCAAACGKKVPRRHSHWLRTTSASMCSNSKARLMTSSCCGKWVMCWL